MRTAKILIRLGGCSGWSESSLGTHAILLVLSGGGSFGDGSDVRFLYGFVLTCTGPYAGGGGGVGCGGPSWANYFKIMQFSTEPEFIYTPKFGHKIRIFLTFAPPPPTPPTPVKFLNFAPPFSTVCVRACLQSFISYLTFLWYRNDAKFSYRYAWANSTDPDQTAARGAIWSGSALLAIPSASFGLITLW